MEGKLAEKNELFIRYSIADGKHPENDEPIEVSISGISIIVGYRDRQVVFDGTDMIQEAVDIIDASYIEDDEGTITDSSESEEA